MKPIIALAVVTATVIPAAFAAPQHKGQTLKHKAQAAATAYACQKCHMRFTAAQAKKDHYKDPMDGGTLLPMRATAGKKTAPVKGMKM